MHITVFIAKDMSRLKFFNVCLSLSMNGDRIQLMHTQMYRQCMLEISIRMVVAIAMLTTHTDTSLHCRA